MIWFECTRPKECPIAPTDEPCAVVATAHSRTPERCPYADWSGIHNPPWHTFTVAAGPSLASRSSTASSSGDSSSIESEGNHK